MPNESTPFDTKSVSARNQTRHGLRLFGNLLLHSVLLSLKRKLRLERAYAKARVHREFGTIEQEQGGRYHALKQDVEHCESFQ